MLPLTQVVIMEIIEVEFWGSSESPDYILSEGVFPHYTGGEYSTQLWGVIHAYTVGKPGPLPSGRVIKDIQWDIADPGDPERPSHHKGRVLIE